MRHRDSSRGCFAEGMTIPGPCGDTQLAHGAAGQPRSWHLIGRDIGIHWAALAEDLDVEAVPGVPRK